MRFVKVVSCFILFLILAVSISVYAAQNEVVVEGMADIGHGNLAQAKELALTQAFRTAIEQVIGTFIDSQTIVRNFKVIEDSILMQSLGYIASYEILENWIQSGVFYVRVKARVKEMDVKQDLDALQLTIKRAGDPRVMVIIPEEHIKRKIPDPAAETEIIRQLLKVGFRLVDQAQVKQVQDKEAFRRALQGDQDAYRQLGSEYGADLLVIGEAFSELSTVNYGFFTCQARVEVKVIRTDTGEILAAHGIHDKAVDISESMAAKKSLANAGAKMAEYLIEVLPKNLTDVKRSLQLSISGISFFDIQLIEQHLKDMHLVDGVFVREYVNGVVRIDVDTSLSPIQLANIIVQWKDLVLDITGMSGAKLELIKK